MYRVLPQYFAPLWITVWLLLGMATVVGALAALVALAYVAGPIAPGLVTAVGALPLAARRIGSKRVRKDA